MSQRLQKFIPLHQVLQQAERFHATASALLLEWSDADDGGQIGRFLKLAANHERVVADALSHALASDVDIGSKETVYQNPPETIPGDEDLSALASERRDLDGFAAGLHVLHRRWISVYEALRATNPARCVDDLLGSCLELVQRLERQLSSAHVQLQDL